MLSLYKCVRYFEATVMNKHRVSKLDFAEAVAVVRRSQRQEGSNRILPKEMRRRLH